MKKRLVVAVPASLVLLAFFSTDWSADRQVFAASAEGRLPITISKATTYITEPLRADGWPDYPAARDRLAAQGVAPENNAVVMLMQAFGPELIEKKDREKFFRQLGVMPPPENGECFVEYDKFLQDHAPEALKETDKEGHWRRSLASRQENRASSHPWSKKECPLVGEWLARNEKPLKRIVEASRLSCYYAPAVSDFYFHISTITIKIEKPTSENPSVTVIGAPPTDPLPVSGALRTAIRALQMRAMLRVHEGDIEQAWADIQACHRLGRCQTKAPTPDEYLTGHTIDACADWSDWEFAHFGRLTLEQSRKCRADIAKLPPLLPNPENLLNSERLIYLNAVCAVARGDASFGDTFPCGKPYKTLLKGGISRDRVDWNRVLILGNECFDSLQTIARKSNWSERHVALAALQRKMEQEAARLGDIQAKSSAKNAEAAGAPPSIATQKASVASLGSYLFSGWGGHPNAYLDTMNAKAAIKIQATEVALALSAYRTDHGKYPNDLLVLTPKYFGRLPNDPYGSGTFRYRRLDEGYLLYSVGENGADDTGPRPLHFTVPPDPPAWLKSDDIGIRMPDYSDQDEPDEQG